MTHTPPPDGTIAEQAAWIRSQSPQESDDEILVATVHGSCMLVEELQRTALERDRYKAFVLACAERGIHADTNPTRKATADVIETGMYYTAYLDRINDTMKKMAKDVLESPAPTHLTVPSGDWDPIAREPLEPSGDKWHHFRVEQGSDEAGKPKP